MANRTEILVSMNGELREDITKNVRDAIERILSIFDIEHTITSTKINTARVGDQ